MAKEMRRTLALVLALVLCAAFLAVPAAAKNNKGVDSSMTELFNKGEQGNSDKAPFDKDNITIIVDGKSYDFQASGSGSWKNDEPIPELDIEEGGSKPITIVHTTTDDEGKTVTTEYSASLTNHSHANGNNGNNKTGTDTYDINGISRVELEPLNPDPTDPDPTDPDPTDPDPTDPEPTDPEPTDPEPTDPEPTDPEPTDPEPTGPEPTDPEPTDPEPTDPEPTDPEPTDPEPTDPDPTDPDPTDPDPTVPAVPKQPRTGGGDLIIDEEPVPLADVPLTGDITGLLVAISLLSLGGIGILSRKRK